MKVVLTLVLAALVGFPQGVDAQGDQRAEQEAALDLELVQWSDLQWLQWLLEVEQRVEPGLLVQELGQPAPPSEGSWLRLEAGFAGMRVVPRPLPRSPPEVPGLSRPQRIGVGIGVALGVLGIVAIGVSVSAFSNSEGGI